MSIRIEQPGLAELYGKAGTIIGQAQRAKEREERASRRMEMLQEFELRKESERLSHQLALDRLRLGAQMQLEGQQRAMAWDIEKKEIASRLDFQRKEQARQKQLDQIDTSIEAIKKEKEAGRIDEATANRLILHQEISKAGIDIPPSLIQPRQAQGMTERERLADIVGPGIARDLSLPDLKEEAESLGYFSPAAIEQTGLGSEDFGATVDYEIGQVIPVQGQNYQVVGFDEDGEPLVEPVAAASPVEIPETRSYLDTLRKMLFSKPLEGRIPAGTASFKAFGR
jgi:hypothetical protein